MKSMSKAEIEWRRRGAKGVFDRKNDRVIPLEQDQDRSLDKSNFGG
jgi:hypothetical protein